MIVELEIFIFGCSAIAYIESISRMVSQMQADIAVLKDHDKVCVDCPNGVR